MSGYLYKILIIYLNNLCHMYIHINLLGPIET